MRTLKKVLQFYLYIDLLYFVFVSLELSILHERKRNRVADFKEEQSHFVEFRDQKRAEVSKIRKQEKQAINQAKAEERFAFCPEIIADLAIKSLNFRRELLNSIEPYEEERQLCATLLSFLGKMELQTPSTPSSCYSSYANTPSEHSFALRMHNVTLLYLAFAKTHHLNDYVFIIHFLTQCLLMNQRALCQLSGMRLKTNCSQEWNPYTAVFQEDLPKKSNAPEAKLANLK